MNQHGIRYHTLAHSNALPVIVVPNCGVDHRKRDTLPTSSGVPVAPVAAVRLAAGPLRRWGLLKKIGGIATVTDQITFATCTYT
jgi:hypothetical protein